MGVCGQLVSMSSSSTLRPASGCRRSAAARLLRGSFTSVYFDVPGESLAAVGITLRRRTENGHGVWQLKLPADDSRLELEAEGAAGQPPEELLALLHAHLRRGPLSA